MVETRDWQRNREMWIRVLEKQTGQGLDTWKHRLAQTRLRDERELRAWLTRHGVTGYARQLLVMERFGYPDFVRANADELIEQQYADSAALRAVYEAVVKAAEGCGAVIVQARKTYVSLVSPRRTFARVQRAGTRVNLALRLDGLRPSGRLQRSNIHETMRLQIPLGSLSEVDTEVRRWLKRAYVENA